MNLQCLGSYTSRHGRDQLTSYTMIISFLWGDGLGHIFDDFKFFDSYPTRAILVKKNKFVIYVIFGSFSGKNSQNQMFQMQVFRSKIDLNRLSSVKIEFLDFMIPLSYFQLILKISLFAFLRTFYNSNTCFSDFWKIMPKQRYLFGIILKESAKAIFR